MTYRIFIPLFFGALAAGAAFGVKAYWGINDLQTSIVGSAIFCILMVLWNYAAGLMFVDRVDKRLRAIVGFENDILRRIEQIEKNLSTSVETEMVRKRVELLEAKLGAGGLPLHEITNGHAAFDAAEYDDDKVVSIHGEGRKGQSAKDKNKPNHLERKARCEAALAEGRLTIRLQPVINLVSQSSIAVEAFGYFELSEGSMSALEVGSELDNRRRGEIDLRVLEALAGIVRSMDEEGQILPVYYGLSSGAFLDETIWGKIRTRLRADAKLASNIVPQISADQLDTFDDKTLDKLLELMEFGLNPCISDCTGLERTTRLVEGKCFKHFKIPAAELLTYTDREGERAADLLLPRIERRKHTLVVSHVEKSHQLSSLIDLDVSAAQGNIISPPREIKPYADVPVASGDN